jgi:hypothetical protein
MLRFTAGCLGIMLPGGVMVGIMGLARRILGFRRIFRPVKVGRYSMFIAGRKIWAVVVRIWANGKPMECRARAMPGQSLQGTGLGTADPRRQIWATGAISQQPTMYLFFLTIFRATSFKW